MKSFQTTRADFFLLVKNSGLFFAPLSRLQKRRPQPIENKNRLGCWERPVSRKSDPGPAEDEKVIVAIRPREEFLRPNPTDLPKLYLSHTAEGKQWPMSYNTSTIKKSLRILLLYRIIVRTKKHAPPKKLHRQGKEITF